MLDPDKELELLEQEYPRSRRAWTHETSASLDARILELADNHAPYLKAASKLRERKAKPYPGADRDRQRFTKPPTDNQPLRSINQESAYTSQESFFDAPAFLRRSEDPTAPPPGTEKLLAELRKTKRKDWLERIADLVRRGEVDAAIYLLEQYKLEFK